MKNKILRNNSGASFVYVMGVMLLLYAIGISALTAASANAGFTQNQRAHTQAILLSDSVQKNILYSLQRDPADETDFLSAQLARAICDARDKDSPYYNQNGTGLEDITLDITFENGVNLYAGDARVEDVTLSFPRSDVTIEKPRGAEFDSWTDEYGYHESFTPRVPKHVYADASMIVTVKIMVNGKPMTSRAHYKYMGGELYDDIDGSHSTVTGDQFFDLIFVDYGKWELIKYEKADR